MVERNINTIGQCVSYAASRLPDKKALLFGDASCTWQELDLWSSYLAYRMLNMGIGKKTHVGIWSVNTPKWIITYLAASKIGAVPVLINTSYSLSELERALVYADVEYFFCLRI